MGWEVKKILRGQSKHGLWGSNLKTGKFLPGGAQEQICCTVFGTMPSLWPWSHGFEQAPSDIDGLGPQIPNIYNFFFTLSISLDIKQQVSEIEGSITLLMPILY